MLLVDDRVLQLLRRLQASGFQDLSGTEAFITIPISEPLLNELLAAITPPETPIRDLRVAPQAADRFILRGRFGSSALLPPLKLTLAVDRQPEFPDFPTLVLRLEATGLLSLAGPALRLMHALPAGIRGENDRIHVDLPALLEARGLWTYLQGVFGLRVEEVGGKRIFFVCASVH